MPLGGSREMMQRRSRFLGEISEELVEE